MRVLEEGEEMVSERGRPLGRVSIGKRVFVPKFLSLPNLWADPLPPRVLFQALLEPVHENVRFAPKAVTVSVVTIDTAGRQ